MKYSKTQRLARKLRRGIKYSYSGAPRYQRLKRRPKKKLPTWRFDLVIVLTTIVLAIALTRMA